MYTVLPIRKLKLNRFPYSMFIKNTLKRKKNIYSVGCTYLVTSIIPLQEK